MYLLLVLPVFYENISMLKDARRSLDTASMEAVMADVDVRHREDVLVVRDMEMRLVFNPLLRDASRMTGGVRGSVESDLV